jgi:dTDP-glucose 4,6-dehydratase
MIKIATVTGCAGFIGQVLTRKLLEDGWLVYGIDKLTYAADRVGLIGLQQHKHFHFIEQDITTLDKLPDCDVLFNLAAESDVDTSNRDSKQFVLTNTLGVQNLLNLVSSSIIIKNEPPLFVQMSTDEVYGATSNSTELFTEESPLNPGNPYAATKAGADLLITSWANTYGLEYIIIRPSNNYGPRQHPEKLIPLAIKKLQRNKKIKLHNNGTPVRTWTHVEDTVAGVLTILNEGKRNTIYNISSEFEQDNLTTITNLLKAYTDDIDISSYLDLTYNRPGQDMRYAICSEKLRQLGWSANYNINEDMNWLITGYKYGEFRW